MKQEYVDSYKINYIALTLTSFMLMSFNSHLFILFMCDVQIYWFENIALAIFPIAMGVSAYLIKRKIPKTLFIITALVFSFLFFPLSYSAIGLVTPGC